MSSLNTQNEEPMFPSIITTLDTYLESVSDDKAFQAMDEVRSGKPKKKKVKKHSNSKSVNLSPLADVKAVPPTQRPSSRKGIDEIASPRKLKALASLTPDGENEDFRFVKDSSLFSSNSPPHVPQKSKMPSMEIPPKPSPRPNPRKYKVAENQNNQYEAPRSASPTVLQTYGQDLGFGKAVETIAAMKLHNFAMKRRDHMSQKLKLLKEIRGFERENKEELIVAQKYRNREFLAAWKLRYYIEYMRLNAMKHIVDVVENKNMELENECATLQQTLTESRQFNTEVNNSLEERTAELQRANAKIAQQSENISHLSTHLAQAQQELVRHNELLEEGKNTKMTDDLTLLGHLQQIDSLRAELAMTRSTCQEVIRTSLLKDEELQHLKDRHAALQQNHSSTVSELSHTKATRSEEAENALMREEDSQIKALRLNQLNQEIDNKSAEINSFKAKVADQEAQIEQLKASLAAAHDEVEAEKAKVNESEVQKASLSKLLTDLAVKVTKLENDAVAVQKVVADLEKKNKKAKDKMKEQTVQIDTMETQITTSQQEIDFLADENEELAREIECHSMYTEDIEARYQRVVELNNRSTEYSRFLEEELFNARKLYKSKIDEGGDRIEIGDESYSYNGKNSTRGKSAGVDLDDDLDREYNDVQSVPRSPQQPDNLLPSIILQLQSFHASPNGKVTFNRSEGIAKPGSRPTTNPFLLSHFINQEGGGGGAVPTSAGGVPGTPVPSTASVLEQKFMSLVKNLEDKLKTVDTVAESLRVVALRAEAFEANMTQLSHGGTLSTAGAMGTQRGMSSIGPRKVVTYSDEMSPEEVEQLQQKEMYISQHLNMENFFTEIMNSLEQVIQELDLQKEEIFRMNEAKNEVKAQISAWRKKFKKATGFEPSEEDKQDHCGDLLNDFNKLKDALNEMKQENNLLAGKANELQTELYNLNNDLEVSGDEFYRLYNEPIADYLPEMMVPQQAPGQVQRELFQFNPEDDEPFSRTQTPGTGLSGSRKTPRSNSMGFGFEDSSEMANVGESGMMEEGSLDRPHSLEDSVNSDESSITKKKSKKEKRSKKEKKKKSKSRKASSAVSDDDNESIALSDPGSPHKKSGIPDLNAIMEKAVAETAALFQDSNSVSLLNDTILEGSVEMTTAEMNSITLSSQQQSQAYPLYAYKDLNSFSLGSNDGIPAGSPVQDVMEQASLSAEMSVQDALGGVLDATTNASEGASLAAAGQPPAALDEGFHFNSLASNNNSVAMDEMSAISEAAPNSVTIVQPKPLMVETGTSYTPQEMSIVLSENVTPQKSVSEAPLGFTEGIAMTEVNSVLDTVNATSPLAHMYPQKKVQGFSPDSLASPLKAVGQGFKSPAAAVVGASGSKGLNSLTHLERKQAQLAKQQAREAVTKLKGEIEQNLSDIESMNEDVALMQATRAEIRLEIVRWIFNFNELCGYHPENIDKIRSRTFQQFVESFVETQNAIGKTCGDINLLIESVSQSLKQLIEAQDHALKLGAVKVVEDFQSIYVLPEVAQFESEDPFVILPESENGVFIAPTAPLVQYDESKVVRKVSVPKLTEEEPIEKDLNTSLDSIPLDALDPEDADDTEDKFEEPPVVKPVQPAPAAFTTTYNRKVSVIVTGAQAPVAPAAPVYNNRKNMKLSIVKYTYVLPSLVGGVKSGTASPTPSAKVPPAVLGPITGPKGKLNPPLPAVEAVVSPPGPETEVLMRSPPQGAPPAAVTAKPSPAAPPAVVEVEAVAAPPVLTKSASREAYELWRKQHYAPSLAAAPAAAVTANVVPSAVAEPKLDSHNRSTSSYDSKHSDSPLPESKKHLIRNMFDETDDLTDRRVFDHKSDELRTPAPAPSTSATPDHKAGGGSAKRHFDQYDHKRDSKGSPPSSVKNRTKSNDSVERNLPPVQQVSQPAPVPAVEESREAANSFDDNNSMISDFKYQQPMFEMMDPEEGDEYDFYPYQGEDYPSEGAEAGGAGGGGAQGVKTPSFFSQPVTPGDNLFVDDPYEFDISGKQPLPPLGQSRQDSYKKEEIVRLPSGEEHRQAQQEKQKTVSDDFSKYFGRDDEDEDVDPKLDSGKKEETAVVAAVPETQQPEADIPQEPSHISLAMPTAEEVVELKKEYAAIKKVLKKWKAAFVKQYGTEPTMADADEMDVDIMRKLERKDELKEILEAYKASLGVAGGGEDGDNEFNYSRPTTAGGLSSRPHTAPFDDLPAGVDPTEYHNALVANMTTPFAPRDASPFSAKAAPAPPVPAAAAPKYSADEIAAMNSEYSTLKKDLKKWKANFVKTVGCEPTMDDFANLDIETMTKISRKEELREILDNLKYGTDGGAASGTGATSESEGYSSSPTLSSGFNPPVHLKNIAAPAFKASTNSVLSQEEVEAAMVQQTQALITPIRPDESLDDLQSEYNKLKKALRKWKATFVAKYQRDPTTNDFEELDIDVKRQIARKNQLKAYLDEHNASDDE